MTETKEQPRRTSEFDLEAQRLLKALDILNSTVLELESRISNVLRQPEPSKETVGEKDTSPNTSMGAFIRTSSDKVTNTRRMVESMLSRLEI